MRAASVVDLNCDLGEGFGWDAELLDVASSANIACGGHAGDETTMREAVRLALRRGVGAGAHPGLVDREGFGRRGLDLPIGQIARQVGDQIRALERIASSHGATLSHVKLHGALYNETAGGGDLADALLSAIREATGCRTLFALAGSRLVGMARSAGMLVAEEGFPDRGYRSDGTLIPRGTPGALVEDPVEVARNAVRLATSGVVDTLCIHGDSPDALRNARAVSEALRQAGVAIQRFAAPGPGLPRSGRP